MNTKNNVEAAGSDEVLVKHMRKEMLLNLVLNIVVNAAIVWLIFDADPPLTMWGENAFAPDLFITATILSWILGSIFIMTHRKKAQKGELPMLEKSVAPWLPQNIILAGMCIAALAVFLYVPLTLAGLYLFNAAEMSIMAFSIFKGLWAGLLACLVVPLAILVGLATSEER